MQRVNNPPSNLYEPGNSALGIRGTRVTAADLNAQQEEVCAVIESEGMLIDPNNSAQLLAAITSKISNKVSVEATARTFADNAHIASTTVHGATSAAAANSIMRRGSTAQSKVGPPSAPDDIARLDSITLDQLGIGARAEEIDSICDGLPSNVNTLSGPSKIITSTSGPIFSHPAANVVPGDVFWAHGELRGTKGAVAGEVNIQLINAGTAGVSPPLTGYYINQVLGIPASTEFIISINGFFRINGAGTFIPEILAYSQGSNFTVGINAGRIYVLTLKKQ